MNKSNIKRLIRGNVNNYLDDRGRYDSAKSDKVRFQRKIESENARIHRLPDTRTFLQKIFGYN